MSYFFHTYLKSVEVQGRAYLELIKYACDLWATDSRKGNQQAMKANLGL